jgi:hypothetical protein
MLRSASSTRSGIVATVVGIVALIVTATAVFSELQAALNVIWKVPAARNSSVWLPPQERFRNSQYSSRQGFAVARARPALSLT